MKENDYDRGVKNLLKDKKVIKTIEKINDENIDLVPIINSKKEVKKIIF